MMGSPCLPSRQGVFAAVAFLVACEGGGPAAPTTPPVVTAPPPAAVSVVFEPTTARVGEVISQTYELSRGLDRAVDIWTEVTPPVGDRYENGPLTFPAGQTVLLFSTGYLGEQHVGDWAMRIMGERLPEGVVLGSPSSATWSVLP